VALNAMRCQNGRDVFGERGGQRLFGENQRLERANQTK
jgi:hypothetical protein